jgi:hypothetical protein
VAVAVDARRVRQRDAERKARHTRADSTPSGCGFKQTDINLPVYASETVRKIRQVYVYNVRKLPRVMYWTVTHLVTAAAGDFKNYTLLYCAN